MKPLSIFIFIFIFSCSGCIKNNPHDSKIIEETFEAYAISQFKILFREISYDDWRYNNSNGTETLIFHISFEKMKKNELEKNINHFKSNGWYLLYKENYSYIFCNNKDQLEIALPRAIAGNSKLEDGDFLRQNEYNWNVGFKRSDSRPTSCDRN